MIVPTEITHLSIALNAQKKIQPDGIATKGQDLIPCKASKRMERAMKQQTDSMNFTWCSCSSFIPGPFEIFSEVGMHSRELLRSLTWD